MKPCTEHKEILWLSVYGEANPSERATLDGHLTGCEDCRKERDQLLRLVQAIKAAMPAPALSPERVATLATSTMRKLVEHQEQPWWKKWVFTIPYPMAQLATAAVVVLVVGWFLLKDFTGEVTPWKTPKQVSQEQLITRDLDVINNLELLKEMDAVTKLVQFLDQPDSESPATSQQSSNLYDGAYV